MYRNVSVSMFLSSDPIRASKNVVQTHAQTLCLSNAPVLESFSPFRRSLKSSRLPGFVCKEMLNGWKTHKGRVKYHVYMAWYCVGETWSFIVLHKDVPCVYSHLVTVSKICGKTVNVG